ncbi:MAG: polymer-forming cytoskeletal protein [Anderseniella sp.]
MFFKKSRAKAPKSGPNSGGRQRHRSGPSLLSLDLVIDGSVSTGGELQVDGTINGTVRARAVVVDGNGVVYGDITAEEVIVRGRVIGPIRALHIHIYAGAHIEGDVINQTLSIENGAHVDGKIRRVEDPLSEPIDQEQGYASSGWGQNYAPPVYDQHYPQENVYSLPGTDDIADDPVYPEPPARKPKAAE